jgi:hypothetical protein
MTLTVDVEAWVRNTQGALAAVAKASAQEMVELIRTPKSLGGRMPIDTSFLVNSLEGSTQSIPLVNPAHDGTTPPITGNMAAVSAMIAGWEMGTSLHFGFTAVYALRQNYGFFGTDTLGRNYSQQGNFFVENSVMRWPQIVEANQRRLAGQLASGGSVSV